MLPFVKITWPSIHRYENMKESVSPISEEWLKCKPLVRITDKTQESDPTIQHLTS